MNKSHVDIDRFLPFGELLRGFLDQPFLSKADLASLLKQRGVFIYGGEKSDTIPWLTNLLISPAEFDLLREYQNTKEDSPKVNTQMIGWNSSESLIDSIPDHFDINSVLDLEFSNFRVIGSPNFSPVDGNPDHLVLEFEIERNDYSKNWSTTQSQFRGSLELTKVREGQDIKVVITHTASETKYVATKASQGIVRHFKEKSKIKESEEIRKIELGTFSNPARVQYFLLLSLKIKSALLKFEDIVDIEISPDPASKLPDKIEWMEERINDVKLNGKGLQYTFFVQDEQLHSYVFLYQVVARFRFDYKGVLGRCIVSIGFPEFERTKDSASELEVNVKNVSFDQPPKYLSKGDMIKVILREFDCVKVTSLDQIINKGRRCD